MKKENILFIMTILSVIITGFFYIYNYELTVVDYDMKYRNIKYDKFGDVIEEKNPLYLAIAEDGKTCKLTVEEWSKLTGIINNENTVEINCEWLASTYTSLIFVIISTFLIMVQLMETSQAMNRSDRF